MSQVSNDSGVNESPLVEHVYFTPVKKVKAPRKLSKIGFPSTSTETDTIAEDYDSSQTTPPSNTTPIYSSPYSNQWSKSTSSFSIPKVLDSTLSKFHKSNASLSNITGSKVPYKASRSNSTASIGTASRANSFTNLQPPHTYLKKTATTNTQYLSPKKSNGRYLATSNDHTLQMGNIQEPISTKALPVSTLPHFNHAHQTTSHAPQRLTSPPTLVPPPTVHEPIKKTNSASSNVEISVPPSSGDSGSSTNSKRNKKVGGGLLQAAAKAVHSRHHTSSSIGSFGANEYEDESRNGSERSYTADQLKLSALSINVNDPAWSAKTNSTSSNNGSCVPDAPKLHLISPLIFNEFRILHESIKFGKKRKLENLDQETQDLLDELDKAYQHLEEMQKFNLERSKDFDTFIENMSTSKQADIETLNPNVMCDNLNDLEVRIEQVKENMIITKDNLKEFDSKLTVLQELKANNEERSKYFKNILVISSVVMFLGISVKVICF